MARFQIGAGCEILVDRGLPDPLLPPARGRRRVAVLVQDGAEQVGERVVASLGEYAVETVSIAAGEAAKELAAVEAVYHRLAEMELGRGDTIVNVGGGAASDAGGFVAATWLRGVEAVNIPTTLLAAVDASIGGKTGLNLAGKNLVGAFHHPSRVIVDLDILDALPEQLVREGSAEAIKVGLLAAPAVVDTYHTLGLSAPMETVVGPAVKVKVDIVAEDFTEQGRRAWLNLGHTIGHGIEFASGLTHGESVALGLVAATAVSTRRLGFDAADYVIETLNQVGLPTRAPELDRARVIGLIGLDKKRDDTGLRMVLLAGIGQPEVVTVTPADIEAGLSAVGL